MRDFGWFLGAVTTTRFLIAPGASLSLSPRNFAKFHLGGAARESGAVESGKWGEKNSALYIYSGEVKVLDGFWGKRGFFRNNFLTLGEPHG
jgi:hypothetical protein